MHEFIFCNTVDALRALNKHGFIKAGIAVVLDELKVKKSAVGAQGGGIDFLKTLFNVTESATLESRYHDFVMPTGVARIVTVQTLDKLHETLGMPSTQWCWDADVKALLKRMIIVQPQKPVLSEERMQEFASMLEDSVGNAMLRHINSTRGDSAELACEQTLDQLFETDPRESVCL